MTPEINVWASQGLGVIVHDHYWFDGYVDDAEKSAQRFSADGRWYLTGDLARIDSDANIFFVARDDDAILMAGYRIGPVEVEAVILEHASVSECAVFAVPDDIRGEALAAAVVLRPGINDTAELATELQQWVKHRYAAHAYPRAVHFLPALPRTPSAKGSAVRVATNVFRRVTQLPAWDF